MASSETKIYHKTLGQAFAAAQKAVRDLGYKVDTLDKTSGLLNFKTGMSWKSWAGQEMSVMIIDNGNGSVEVSVSGVSAMFLLLPGKRHYEQYSHAIQRRCYLF